MLTSFLILVHHYITKLTALPNKKVGMQRNNVRGELQRIPLKLLYNAADQGYWRGGRHFA
jgi:hypothetical protein